MNTFLRKTIWLSAIMLFMVVGFGAQAEDKIDVEYPVGTNLNSDDIFNENNILPGWSESKTIRVENDSETDDVNLYFKFDLKSGDDLAKELKLYVIRKSDGSYRIGGAGDRYDLEKADDEGDLYVGRLDPEESNQYEIKVKLDESIGNEFQGLESKFDIDFQIESRTADDRTETQILADQGRVVTGEAPEEEAGEPGESVQGVISEEEGEIAGEETMCASWPLWFWILALIVFTILSLISTRNIEEEKAGKHFTWQLVGVAIMLFIWYLFDKCPHYKWFPVAIIIAGIGNHVYFRMFKSRKKVIDENQE